MMDTSAAHLDSYLNVTQILTKSIILVEHVSCFFYNLNIMVTMDTPAVLKITPLDLSHLTAALSTVGLIASWEFSPAGVMLV